MEKNTLVGYKNGYSQQGALRLVGFFTISYGIIVKLLLLVDPKPNSQN